MSSVLLVDDEPQALLGASTLLRTAGVKDILTVEDSRKVMDLLASEDVAVVVIDLMMPHVTGTELLGEIQSDFPQTPVIVMTALDELETAVQCMKAGAFDYLVKPVEKDRFVSSIKRALEMHAVSSELHSLKHHLLADELEHEAAFSAIITGSKKMQAVFQYIEAISSSPQPVLITGETGVGKELVAVAIHEVNALSGEFVAVNTAGLDDTMFSDTLFGHKKGAYTGAGQAREGLIARASGGTLFLDEIGDLNKTSQVKLLRLMQEQTYYPLGSDVPRQSDARIIVATNQELQGLISEGKFRKDLYYRLRAHQIRIPPLRERREDIPLLLEHFLGTAAESLEKKKPTPPPELLALLCAYYFPGNVRELQSMVYDAVARHKSGMLSMAGFKEIIGEAQPPAIRSDTISKKGTYSNGKGTLSEKGTLSLSGRLPTLKEAEEYLITESMRLSSGNQGTAATLLGITRQALNKRLLRKTNAR